MLRRALEGALTPAECDLLFSAFDQIGGIIVVRIPDSLLARKELIGRTLLEQVKPARSVYCQLSDVRGEHRTRDLELLAGEDSTRTEYRENGCRFAVDVEHAFVSPRLSTERERIAGLVRDGETVVNMFAGVGMFSIVAARQRRCTVHSIDINPLAIRLCQESIAMNRLAGSVLPVCGDAARIIGERLRGASDRTLMLLPERSDEFLEAAVAATRDGGTVHYYSHIHADRRGDAPALAEGHYLEVAPPGSRILNSRIVRAVGPRYYQTVVDAEVRKP